MTARLPFDCQPLLAVCGYHFFTACHATPSIGWQGGREEPDVGATSLTTPKQSEATL